MRAQADIFPSLGRYFDTLDELASSACMCRQRAWRCLRGDKVFTDQEKRALANAIIAKMITHQIDDDELDLIIKARDDFDTVFKRSENT